jgi:hypothetical protein
MENMKGAYRVLVERPEGKRPLVRPEIGWENNIKWIFKTGGGMDWIDLAQERDGCLAVVYAVMNIWVP